MKIDDLDKSGIQGQYNIQFHMPSKTAEDLYFYLDNIGHYRCAPTYKLVREKYYSFLILCTVAGQGELEYNGRLYRLDRNHILYLNTYGLHSYYPHPRMGSWEFYWLHFDGKLAKSYFDHILKKRDPVIQVKDSTKVAEAIAKIYEMKTSEDSHFEMNTSAVITKTLNWLMLAAKEQSQSSERFSDVVNCAIDYIKSNYQQPIHTSDVADYVHLSKSHFIRTFKEQTGVAPHEYLIKYRIIVAKTQLAYSERSVATVSRDVGFFSVSNFITTFRKMEGITPYQYRKNSMTAAGK